MRFSRKHIYMAATPLILGGMVAGPAMQAGAAVIKPPVKDSIVLKDGRALDEQLGWRWNAAQHRWVYGPTGKVVVNRYEVRDRNHSQDFKLVYGPLGKMAFIQYTGPGKYHNWYVQTSDKHAPGIPPTANYGYVGSKLVKFAFEATVFTASQPGPLGYRTLTVPAAFGPTAHGPEILTGEIFGQLGLNAQKPLLPTNAQLFMQR